MSFSEIASDSADVSAPSSVLLSTATTANEPRRSWIQHVVPFSVLTLLCVPLFFYRTGERALWSSHEGRAGQHAQLMLDTGRWGIPKLFFGEADYQKPPLFYWLVAAAAWLRGGIVDAWAVRAPATLSALAGVWLTYALGTVMWRRRAVGFVAAVMLASSLRYTWLARVGRIDMPLTLAVGVVLACFWLAYREFSKRHRLPNQSSPSSCNADVAIPSDRQMHCSWWMLPTYVATSIAVMLKGPIGVLLPVIAIICFLALERQPIWPWRRGFGELAHGLGVWWGIPLVLLIAGPWFVWATVESSGEFFKTFFLHHNFNRTLGVEGLKPGPSWYYIPQLFLDIFPWSLLIPGAIYGAIRHRGNEQNSSVNFALAWTISMFVFLSIVRFKRHDYLLPLLPGLVLLLAAAWNRQIDRSIEGGSRRWVRSVVWSMFLGAIAIPAVILLARTDRIFDRVMNSSIARNLMRDDWLAFGPFQTVLKNAPGVGVIVASLAILGAVCGLLSVHFRRPQVAAGSVAIAWTVCFLSFVRWLLPSIEPFCEQATLAAAARQIRPEGTRLYYYGREDQQLMFYLGPGSRWLPDRVALRPVITQSEPVFVVMELERYLIRQKDWPEVNMVPLVRNTDNASGTHHNPAVLVTNASGWRLVQTRHAIASTAN